MSLHEYMLPNVVHPAPRPVDLFGAKLPSPLFVGADPRSGEVLLEEGYFSSARNDEVKKATGTGYKHWRRQYALEPPFVNSKVPYYVDFEDACYNPREIYFGRDFNVFQYNRRRGDRTSVLWSLPNYFEPSRGVGHPPRGTANDVIPFADKTPRAYWRGGISGTYSPNPYIRSPFPLLSASSALKPELLNRYSRLKLVMQYKESGVVDAKFAGNTVDRGMDESALALGLHSEPVSANSMMQYKYLICPAGNDVSSAMYWVLRTNSLAFKEENEFETIPDYFLKPWVHYVPIAPGFHDLIDKFEYCEANASQCEKMIENANRAYSDIVNAQIWSEAKRIVLERLGMLAE